jgi:arylsulfatase A-like enzyme
MYGYDKDTTPFLADLSKTSLVGENHFSNAQGTIGSLTSMLTGKYPADVRVLASKDILEGEDAYQHLPGLLKKYGYKTVQLTYSYYADAGNLNIQDGFDLANGETAATNPVSSTLSSLLPTDYYYFLRELYIRATDRLAHIFFIKDMKNPYKQMTESPDKFNDAYKMQTALALLEESQKPLFIHIHWMGAHGPKYYPEEQVFSAGKDPSEQGNRDEDFYLDSILEFDTSLAEFYSKLDSLGIMDNTVLIVTSDHTQKWSISRIPLLVHFPGNEFAGEITSNTENLDITPTILDYLDIPQPNWMAGQSLLGSFDPTRPIFIAQIGDSSKDAETGKISYPEPVAPFYQFGKMSVVSCDTWYKLNLLKKELTTGKVKYYVGQCTGSELTARQALALIETHLDKYGFDVSSLAGVKMPQ